MFDGRFPPHLSPEQDDDRFSHDPIASRHLTTHQSRTGFVAISSVCLVCPEDLCWRWELEVVVDTMSRLSDDGERGSEGRVGPEVESG